MIRQPNWEGEKGIERIMEAGRADGVDDKFHLAMTLAIYCDEEYRSGSYETVMDASKLKKKKQKKRKTKR